MPTPAATAPRMNQVVLTSAGEVHAPIAGRIGEIEAGQPSPAHPPVAREAEVGEVDRAGHRTSVKAGADFVAEPEGQAVGGRFAFASRPSGTLNWRWRSGPSARRSR